MRQQLAATNRSVASWTDGLKKVKTTFWVDLFGLELSEKPHKKCAKKKINAMEKC
jgi:hypothetical protein